MNISKLYIPGDNPVILQGVAGKLAAMIMCPDEYRPDYLAVLGHPHSLQGGSMQNKVVTTMARTFRELGIPSVRFNFRGVGASEGEYNAGIGEGEDMVAIVKQLSAQQPELKICLAGFSFGSYVTYRAATVLHPQLLVSIAPPVNHYDFNQMGSVDNLSLLPTSRDLFAGSSDVDRAIDPANKSRDVGGVEVVKFKCQQTLEYIADPWIIVQGDQDEVVDAAEVYQWHAKLHPEPRLIRFANTGHFFHAKLTQLKIELTQTIISCLKL